MEIEEKPPYEHDEYVTQLVAGFPPLTEDQKEKLAALLQCGRLARDHRSARVRHGIEQSRQRKSGGMSTEDDWVVPDTEEQARWQEAVHLEVLWGLKDGHRIAPWIQARLEAIWKKFDPEECELAGPNWRQNWAATRGRPGA